MDSRATEGSEIIGDQAAREKDDWHPSAGWTLFGIAMSYAIRGVLILAAFACAIAGYASAGPTLLFLSLILIHPAAVAVHEIGHYVAARSMGMTVLAMRIGALDFAPTRRGWRVRWKRYIHPVPQGYVYAVPDPDRPFRRPMIVFALGGVAASLLLAATVAAFIPWIASPARQWALAGACFLLLIPVCNLLPARGGLQTDGRVAWRWWKYPIGEARMRPVLAMSRVVNGTPESLLDEPDRIALMDESILGMWFMLKRDQQTGVWATAANHTTRLDAMIPTERYARSAYAETIDMIRSELAFSDAVEHGDEGRLPNDAALRRARWSNPVLAYRCAAWQAYRVGDRNAWRQAMDAVMRTAERCADRSTVASERMIANRLYREGWPSP